MVAMVMFCRVIRKLDLQKFSKKHSQPEDEVKPPESNVGGHDMLDSRVSMFVNFLAFFRSSLMIPTFSYGSPTLPYVSPFLFSTAHVRSGRIVSIVYVIANKTTNEKRDCLKLNNNRLQRHGAYSPRLFIKSKACEM